MPTLKIQKADGTFEFLQLAGEEFADIGNQVLGVKAKIAQTETDLRKHGILLTDFSDLVNDEDWTSAFNQAIEYANGKKVIIPSGTYFINNVESDKKTLKKIFENMPVHLVGMGEVVLKANRERLPKNTGDGETEAKATRNILNVKNTPKVILENITFDGGWLEGESVSGLGNTHYDYQMAMLEVRNCEQLEMKSVYFTRNISAYPLNGSGGLEHPDDVEYNNQGTAFLRDCKRVILDATGVLAPSHVEGLEIMECNDVRVSKFYSDSKDTWTPLNIWGKGSTATVTNSVFKYSPGSALGMGGEDADISVTDSLFIEGGGVNLTRQVGVGRESGETKGFKNAVVSGNTFTDTYKSSHGFLVKAGRIPRTWSGTEWSYAYGNLSVEGNTMDGGFIGIAAEHIRNVSIDNNILRNVVEAPFTNHSNMRGKAVYVRFCEHVKVDGVTVDSRGSVLIDGVQRFLKHGIHMIDCTYAQLKDNVVNCWNILDGKGIEVEIEMDAKASSYQNKHFRVMDVIGNTIIGAGGNLAIGTVDKKLPVVHFKDNKQFDKNYRLNSITWAVASVRAYRLIPFRPTILTRSNWFGLTSNTVTKVTFNAITEGNVDEIVDNEFRPLQRGYYELKASVLLKNVPANSKVQLMFYKNGTLYRGIPISEQITANQVSDVVLNGSVLMEIRDTQNADVRVLVGGVGATLDRAYFDINLVSEVTLA